MIQYIKHVLNKLFARAFPLPLRGILLIVNMTVVLLPLGSIFFFRIYENQLIGETEVNLTSHAAFIAEAYKSEIAARVSDPAEYGLALDNPPPFDTGEYYKPIPQTIDLASDPILPPRPDGILPDMEPDPIAVSVGNELTKLMIEIQKTTLAGMKVLDFKGISVAGRFELGLSFAHVDEIKRALNGEYVSLMRQRISDEPPPPLYSISRGTGIRLFIAYPIRHKNRLWGVVYVSRTPKSILKHMYAEKNKLIWAGLTVIALTLLIGALTSWTIARPIYRLIEQTRRISAGERDGLHSLRDPRTKELQLLSDSFLEMAASLQNRSDYIRDFASHVSHEFKTPLTSIGGAAELLLEHFDTMSEKERARFLNNITHDTDRLRRLVSRLLELARADNIAPTHEPFNIHTGLKAIHRKYNSSSFEVHYEEESPFSVIISEDNFHIILSNMIENSMHHNASKVTISVAGSENNEVHLTIADDGDGISSTNMEKIFTPFFTTRREQGGTGLGLDIVKSLIEAHKGSIRCLSGDKGAIFRLALPVASMSVP